METTIRLTQPLTRREEEVLTLICQGKMRKEIADALGLTEAGAKGHLEKIYKKFNAHSNISLALYCIGRGIRPNPYS